ncbi:MAG: DUF4430 domain-containing protein [Solibacillus sp.]
MNKVYLAMQQYKRPLLYVLLSYLLFVFVIFTYSTNRAQDNFDFSTPFENASSLKLAGEASTNSEVGETTSITGNTKNDKTEESSQQPEAPAIEQSSQIPTEQKIAAAENYNATSTNSTNKQSDLTEIVDEAEEQNHYFSTNLTNNETITEPVYYVTISHLDETLTPITMDVSLNNELLTDFNGELTFNEGKNIVTFTATYKDADGKLLTATQTYTISLNSKEIVILTNLKNSELTDPAITFTAQAKKAAQKVDLTVSVNDTDIPPLGGTAYKADLRIGENTITLVASLNGEQIEKAFTVHYEKIKSKITLHTDLEEKRVSSADFSFYASATADDDDVPLTVTLNDAVITSANNKDYTVTLVHGTNIIKLEGDYNDEELARQFKLVYKDPNVKEEVKVDPNAPKLVTDLKTGTAVKGDIKTINVWPTTASGERIRGKNVLVKVNGTHIPFTWDDSTKTSYKLVLQEGENNISIKAWDDDGRAVTENFVVHSEAVEDNSVIGQVTMSLEASTLGIDHLIPPTKMDIHKGEKGSYILDQFLRNHGFTYNQTGSLDNNFYLQAINKKGILTNLSIPDDLWALIEENSTYANKADYSPDSLGEFDFANGSGWMYSVNGDFPNYGFSDAYFLDGDIVRIRFTLGYGKDINGFGGMGGGSGGDWNKEW